MNDLGFREYLHVELISVFPAFNCAASFINNTRVGHVAYKKRKFINIYFLIDVTINDSQTVWRTLFIIPYRESS